jgi:hypothetical protein
MKSLAFPFERSGFRYELIDRQELVCLVKQTRLGRRYWCFEVVKLIPYPDQIRFGAFVPAHECYPSDEHWGNLRLHLPPRRARESPEEIRRDDREAF